MKNGTECVFLFIHFRSKRRLIMCNFLTDVLRKYIKTLKAVSMAMFTFHVLQFLIFAFKLKIFISSEKQEIYFILGKMFQLDLDGKAAALGSLYSAYSNEFFDGISFWNNSLIESNKDILLQTSSNLGKRNLSPMTSPKK